MDPITIDELYVVADRNISDARAVPGGVALPDRTFVQPGAILGTDNARWLAAQLWLAADEYDGIQDLATAHLDPPSTRPAAAPAAPAAPLPDAHRLRELLAFAFPYTPKATPDMAGGEYDEKWREIQELLDAWRGPGSWERQP